jgi:hypothetical protein
VDVDLFDRGAPATSRPAWQVIEAARRRYLTALLVLETTPITNVYLRDGQVYFADRSTDGGLGVRLLVEGVITREQMHRATLMVGGVEHLGRMFDRDSTIDRDAVELCVELMTDDVLTAVADIPVSGYTLHLYKRHPSGVDRWLPTRVEVVTHLVSDPALLEDGTEVAPGAGPRSRPHLTPPPATGEVKVPIAQHAPSYVSVSPVTPPATPTVTPMPLMSLAEAVTDVVPVVAVDDEQGGTAHTETAHTDLASDEPPAPVHTPTFAGVPPAAFTTLQIPSTPTNGTTTPTNGTAPLTNGMPPTPTNGTPADPPAIHAVVEVHPSSLADEVAEAVRRALAAIDQP